MTWSEVAQLLTALGVVGNCAISFRNSRKIDASNENVKKIEIATNHMKDALVESTKVASHAQGLAEGLAEGKASIAPRGTL